MPAVASVEVLCNRLARSGLVRRQYVQTVYHQWKKQGLPSGLASDVDRFAKWLVANHYLTAYQAQQLVLGQTDHFFLNHYRLLDLIGQGRMAGIYKAAHVSGHVVAVKLMPQIKSKDATLLARFRREGKMAVRLKHAHVVRTFHLGREGERFYLVMEYLEGETLEDLLKRRKKLPYPEAARIIHQALLGLQYINDEGMVHRDLKPGNLMLVPLRPPGAPDTTIMQSLKILDIGLGRVMFDEHGAGDQDNLTLTNEGVMLGTPDYMAPEQAKNAHTVDIRADMYALGCVLYHLIAGRLPFIEASPVMQMVAHASQKAPPLRSLEPSVPEALQLVVDTLMAKDPNQRYPSPVRAAQSLAQFVPQVKAQLPEAQALGKTYHRWVETQPVEEVEGTTQRVDRWQYKHNNKVCGPVGSIQLDQLAAAGKLAPDDLIWLEGDDPALAIRARAAVDFTNIKTAPLDTGFDAATGRVIDPEKFKSWQKQQRAQKAQEVGGPPTLQEAYVKARTELSAWLDLPRNRPLILAGDMNAIRQDPGMTRFMQTQQRYGPEMLHKLWAHLEYMVENRRRYFYALGG